ncbi:carbamoyl-phosphate synthase (glutamine-hydrolyzing) cpa2, partial [Blyttiomyces sp. JEL0837]
MVDPGFSGFQSLPFKNENLDTLLTKPTDRRLFAVGKAMIDEGYSVQKIHDMTKIDLWFLYKLENILNTRRQLEALAKLDDPLKGLSKELLSQSKRLGFSDSQIAGFLSSSTKKYTQDEIRKYRKDCQITPFVKRIDTMAAEHPASTNYLYTTYSASTHDVEFNDNGIMVLGSGVYRIGSSVEFDSSGVGAIRSLREMGKKTVMVNYNPETVSTDFDECDRLYFEELGLERVLDIYELENSSGVIVSVGGQLPQNIALPLHERGVKVLGTSPVDVDRAEDRYKFSSVLDSIGVGQPAWKELTSVDEALKFANGVG